MSDGPRWTEPIPNDDPTAGPVEVSPSVPPASAALPPRLSDSETQLIRASRIVVRVGLLSLSAGTGSYRVKESMRRVARAIGIERHQAHVTLTEITSTSHRGDSFRTEVAETHLIGVDAARLQELQDLADQLEKRAAGLTVEQVEAELDRIERRSPLHRAPLNALSAGFTCAALAFLIGGGPVEVTAALAGAASGQLLRRALTGRHLNPLGITMLAAALASSAYLVTAAAAELAFGPQPGTQAGFFAAALFLLPGFPLITAGLDLARLNLSAGIARLTYAIMLIGSAGLVVWVVAVVVDIPPAMIHPSPLAEPLLVVLRLAEPLLVVLRLAASFVGAASFAVLFNGTWRIAGLAGVGGMIANTVRLELIDIGVLPQAAAAVAALIVGLLSAVFARRAKVPRITISVPAVLIMIPGAVVYQAIYALAEQNAIGTITFTTQVILSTAALPFGIALSRMLTDRTWALER